MLAANFGHSSLAFHSNGYLAACGNKKSLSRFLFAESCDDTSRPHPVNEALRPNPIMSTVWQG